MDGERALLTEEEKWYISKVVEQAQENLKNGLSLTDVINSLRIRYRRDFPKKTYRDHRRPDKLGKQKTEST